MSDLLQKNLRFVALCVKLGSGTLTAAERVELEALIDDPTPEIQEALSSPSPSSPPSIVHVGR